MNVIYMKIKLKARRKTSDIKRQAVIVKPEVLEMKRNA